VTLRVELVVPDGQVWSGEARMVIAKTLDGDLGVLGGHPPVLGILAEGGVVQVLDAQHGAGRDGATGEALQVAVSSGFLSVHDDRVSILARQAELGHRVDRAAVKAELDAALAEAPADEPETPEVKYSRARLRAAGDGS
jgi:F-type H+-transporting ATPase subunit epsilon